MCFSSMIKPVLVLRVPNDVGTTMKVPLTCGEAYQSQSVFWKKDGKTTVITVNNPTDITSSSINTSLTLVLL